MTIRAQNRLISFIGACLIVAGFGLAAPTACSASDADAVAKLYRCLPALYRAMLDGLGVRIEIVDRIPGKGGDKAFAAAALNAQIGRPGPGATILVRRAAADRGRTCRYVIVHEAGHILYFALSAQLQYRFPRPRFDRNIGGGDRVIDLRRTECFADAMYLHFGGDHKIVEDSVNFHRSVGVYEEASCVAAVLGGPYNAAVVKHLATADWSKVTLRAADGASLRAYAARVAAAAARRRIY